MLHPCKQKQLLRGCKINNEASSSFKYCSQNILDSSWGSSFDEYTIMIPVEGHKHLYREESGAIINTDKNGYANYMRAKNKKLSERREIDDLRNEIDELKNQLRQLLDR